MRWPKIILTVMCLATGLIVANVGTADMIYNESILGDFSNFEAAGTNLGTFDDGVHAVVGQVGGTNNPNIGDGFDVFAFTIDVNHKLDSILVTDYQTSGGNLSTGFNLYNGSGTFLGSTAIDVGDIGSDVLSLIGTGDLTAGDYYVSLREFTAPNQSYSFSFTVVPEPTAMLGLTIVSVAGMLIRRRRSVAS